MSEVATVSRLETLLDLYSKGYQSPVIDQTIEKLVNLESDRIRSEVERLATRLQTYEGKYGMKSEQFYFRFMNGELGDEMDFVEWSIFWEMYRSESARYTALGERAV
ncbi:MAG: hypothetical protein HY328_13180 [Chloroflexi bacterium]|nr:hypothetical protein [Chloroflexota bacterium]